MELEKRALYNSLRMHWLMDPSILVEPWQVEDYRQIALETLFKRLKEKHIDLDRISFLALANEVDTPEELTETLVADAGLETQEQDQIYLLIFELWRRLQPEKPSLSIFCDELDHEIYRYDRGEIDNPETIQDLLANLAVVLDENSDYGVDPIKALDSISEGCANDLESFLYDFIAERIDNGNYSYASELLDAFTGYIKEKKWFDFLKTRVMAVEDPEAFHKHLGLLVDKALTESDKEFNLELLAFMVQEGDQNLFLKLARHTVPTIQSEEDFQDLVSICADYYRCLDQDEKEKICLNILKQRSGKHLDAEISLNDASIEHLFNALTR